ncbi:MAG TPA: DUF1592 domain-containing protein [Planctomycetota bacterium]
MGRAWVLAALLLGNGAAAAPQGAPPGYGEVKKLLDQFCLKCHGPVKPKAKLDLSKYPDEASLLKDRRLWKRVLDQVVGHEMPPEDKPQPAPAEREKITAYLEAALEKLTPGEPRHPGRVVLRRLNRVEYRRTIKDLVGVEFDPTADFPSDDVGYGFDNIGDVLSLPPLLMEKYFNAAERILAAAVQTPEGLKPRTRRIEAESMKVSTGGQVDGDVLCMYANGEMAETADVARPGTYLVKVRAAGDQAGGEPPKISLRVDGKEAKVVEVSVPRRDPKVYEEKIALAAGKRRISAAFVNDFYNAEAPKARDRDRNLYVDWIELTGPVDGAAPEPPVSHKRIFLSTSKEKRAAAAENLTAFAEKAYRRPLREGELEKLLKLYDLAEAQGESFEASMRVPLLAALVSPHFLYRVEKDVEGDPKGVHRVGAFELASRLSYFLWSTMPDEALFAAARSGALLEPAELEAQTRRMLKDPKARSLAETFAVQWLQLRRLETHAPDPKRYPGWDEALRKAMLEEAVLLFDEVVKEDRPVTELLSADFTYLNERLAKHYGVQGVAGPEMRRVALADPRRGGVLMLGSVLTVTSNPTRTAAVKRGKWLMEVILGTPPPPPLPDAGELKDETDEDRKLSLRLRLEKHRADPNCAACHRRMDPLGFGFENYDAIGAWREKDGTLKVDSAATLPDGKSFDGSVDLKKILIGRKDDFVRNLVEKTLIYALGRGVEYYDGPEVKRIRKALADNDYRFSTLALEVAQSYPFQHRRNRAASGQEVKDD